MDSFLTLRAKEAVLCCNSDARIKLGCRDRVVAVQPLPSTLDFPHSLLALSYVFKYPTLLKHIT